MWAKLDSSLHSPKNNLPQQPRHPSGRWLLYDSASSRRQPSLPESDIHHLLVSGPKAVWKECPSLSFCRLIAPENSALGWATWLSSEGTLFVKTGKPKQPKNFVIDYMQVYFFLSIISFLYLSNASKYMLWTKCFGYYDKVRVMTLEVINTLRRYTESQVFELRNA